MRNGGGASAPLLFLLICMLWVRWRRDARYSAVRGTCGCRSQKVVARADPPCGPLRGSGPWLARPPPALLDSPASPPPTAGRACAPPCRGSAACSRGGGNDSMGGRCRRRSSVVGGAPLSGGCGGACRVWGRGLLSWRRPGLGRSLRFTQSPRAAPPPVPAPLRLRARGGGFRWLRPAGTE